MTEPTVPELEARLSAASDPVARVDALVALAWALRTSSQTPRAHVLATEARELAIEHGYELGQARAARTMAMTVVDPQGLGTKILELAEEAKSLFDEVGDGPGRAGSRDFLATLYEFMGDLSRAMQYALDALAIAREIEDPVRQAYALSSVGGILAASDELETAIPHLEEGLAIFETLGDVHGQRVLGGRLASVCKKAGRREDARRHADRLLGLTAERDDAFGRYSALAVLAELEDESDHFEEAERLYRDAMASFPMDDVARHLLATQSQLAIGKLLLRQDRLEEAATELEDVLEQVRDESASVMVWASAHEALAELHERRDEHAAALEHLRAAHTLRDGVAKQEARNKQSQIEQRAATEAAKKDAEIHRLRFVELHEMQAKLVEAEKMALLGRLAAGAAHELNSPLGALRSNTETAATASRKIAELAQDIGETHGRALKLASVLESCREENDTAIGRVAAIVDRLRRFTQLDEAERREFDAREGLEDALELLASTAPPDVIFERRFEDLPPIDGWPRELNHAFLTVLQNAVEAIEGAGTVSVETSASAGWITVCIRDTGRGMSAEQVAQLFDVGWSQSGTRTTMRLGLSAAYATATKHGGTIEVDSVLDEGTSVTFRLPLSVP